MSTHDATSWTDYAGRGDKVARSCHATRRRRRLGCLGPVEEVADAYCFPTSDRASFVTGQVLHVRGGTYPTPTLAPPTRSIRSAAPRGRRRDVR
ncbi:SDR family oxidoreductase [Haloplanus litoreus]|uniref:SDR family oxidoreductase n=1 Tax=Haloplanus litoreus TaxID=767515 RepID=A0ABD5ZW82_9EURY